MKDTMTSEALARGPYLDGGSSSSARSWRVVSEASDRAVRCQR